MKYGTVFSLALCLCATALVAEEAALQRRVRFPSSKSVVEIPFRDDRGAIIVQATINGSRPLEFALDTGSPLALLYDGDALGDMELQPSRKESNRGLASFLPGSPHTVRLNVGGVVFEDTEMLVLSGRGEEEEAFFPEDGILGGQLFADTIVQLDWLTHRIRLYDPSEFTPPKGAAVLPIHRSNGYIYLDAEVVIDGGKPQKVELFVDTGAVPAFSLHAKDVSPPKRRYKNVAVGYGLGGELRGDLGRVDLLRLGDVELTDVLTSFFPNRVPFQAEGTIGLGVLRRFRVTFDYLGGRIFLEPTDAVRDPFPFSRSGLQVEPRLAADGSLGIRQVYVDSPAAKAGMSRGDALLAIDSRPVAALGVKGVRALLRQPPGVLVRLKVRQGTSAVEVEIELADLL